MVNFMTDKVFERGMSRRDSWTLRFHMPSPASWEGLCDIDRIFQSDPEQYFITQSLWPGTSNVKIIECPPDMPLSHTKIDH